MTGADSPISHISYVARPLTHWGRDKWTPFRRRHFQMHFLEWKCLNSDVPKGPINSIPAMVQIMAWRRPGAKPLPEPMMVSLPTHICVARPQWVNSSPPSAAYTRQWIGSALVQTMACRLFGAKPWPEQCCLIVNWTPGKILQWNANQNPFFFI